MHSSFVDGKNINLLLRRTMYCTNRGVTVDSKNSKLVVAVYVAVKYWELLFYN